MISRQHRFHGYNSLNFVYRKGQTVRNQLISLKFVHNDRQSTYRAAVIVSRKVQKSAVARNRIRRRLYEIIRASEPGITEAYDIVLTVFSEQVAEIPPVELTQQVTELLRKADIIKTEPVQNSPAAHAIVKSNEETL
jgi:ribonuclease P protein component